MTVLLLTDYALFFGRFHPLVVHLPIGFLLLAIVLEWLPGERVRPAIRTAWVLGAISAVVAAGAGWLLASGGSYGEAPLNWHRWSGTGLALLAVAGCWVSGRGGPVTRGYGALTAATLTLAGHLGGNLTHGEHYLYQYAPPVVRSLAGYASDGYDARDWAETDPDSIRLYASLLRPAIDAKCVRCHNAEKANGGLRMDSAAFLFAGGDSGPLLLPGKASDSRWINRVTLPRENAKAMPPQGTPMTFTEIRLLMHWIDQGADTAALLVAADVHEDLQALLLRDLALDLRARLFVETLRVPPADEEIRSGLRALQWKISELLPDGGALEVQVNPGSTVTPGALQELATALPDQVAYLSLENQPLSGTDLDPLPRFVNLNRLKLNGSGATTETVKKLAGLPHLEMLNLYGTAVGDEVFAALGYLPALRRVYLWRTRVTPEAAATFAATHPGVILETGFTLPELNTTK